MPNSGSRSGRAFVSWGLQSVPRPTGVTVSTGVVDEAAQAAQAAFAAQAAQAAQAAFAAQAAQAARTMDEIEARVRRSHMYTMDQAEVRNSLGRDPGSLRRYVAINPYPPGWYPAPPTPSPPVPEPPQVMAQRLQSAFDDMVTRSEAPRPSSVPVYTCYDCDKVWEGPGAETQLREHSKQKTRRGKDFGIDARIKHYRTEIARLIRLKCAEEDPVL